MIVLLMVPVVYSTSISLYSDSQVIEGEQETASFLITTETPFNGSVYIDYNNVQSSVTTVPIISTNFYGLGLYTYPFEWTFKGIVKGPYMISLRLENQSGKTVAVNQKQGYVNNSNPIILTKYPTGIVTTTSTSIEVTTNENADCRYSTENKAFEDMSGVFEITGEKVHSHVLIELEQGNKYYYVKCNDTKGYKSNNATLISFLVNYPPTAEIDLSDNSPVKAGTIKVTIVTSENLEQAPTLEYSFEDAPNTRKIVSLTGSDSLWKGYMIITEDDDNKVGTFYFSGKDEHSTIGREITAGKSFVVDTTKPLAPESVEAKTGNNERIELDWYYDGEEVDHFNIYRATSSGVDYVDYYDETDDDEESFTDRSTEDKVTYYYKINAVDKAGNAGELSDEVFATALEDGPSDEEDKEPVEQEAPKVLPPNLVIRVNDVIGAVDSLLIDIESISSNIASDDEELVTDLEIDLAIKTAENKLNSLRNTLEGLKLQYRTASQLETELDKVDLEIKKLKQTTPRDLTLISKTESIQSLGEEYIDLAIDKLFENPEFETVDKETYKKKNQKIHEFIEVSAKVYLVEIEYIDFSKKEKTFVVKTISYTNSDTIEDVILYEIIPKVVAENVDTIDFLKENYEVVEPDPIIKFGFTELDFNGKSLKYIINKGVSADDARKTATVVLVAPLQLENLNQITGFSIADIFSAGLGFTTKNLIFILIGVFVIIILVGYQVMVSKGYTLDLNIMDRFRIKDDVGSLSSKDSVLNVDDTNAYEVITQLIDWSYEYIDNGLPNKAKLLYPRIALLYKNLSKKSKEDVSKKCLDLQEKLKK